MKVDFFDKVNDNIINCPCHQTDP